MEISSVVESSSEFHGERAAAMGMTKKPGRCYDYVPDIAVGDDHMFEVEAKSGSASAFGALYERHSSEIYRSAYRILRNPQDAEDAVQRSFQRALTNLVRFSEDSSISTWMTRITINEALMLLRQRRLNNRVLSEKDNEGTDAHRALDPTDKQSTPEQALAKEEMRGAVVRAISKLRPRLRVVVLLREMNGPTSAETARRLCLTIGCVKARTFQAKRHLRRYFEFACEGARTAFHNGRCNHGR